MFGPVLDPFISGEWRTQKNEELEKLFQKKKKNTNIVETTTNIRLQWA